MVARRRMIKVRVGRAGVIVLPESVRAMVGIEAGDELQVKVVDGKIVLEPAKNSDTSEPKRAVKDHKGLMSYDSRGATDLSSY
mgnify:CR=1 FL=1